MTTAVTKAKEAGAPTGRDVSDTPCPRRCVLRHGFQKKSPGTPAPRHATSLSSAEKHQHSPKRQPRTRGRDGPEPSPAAHSTNLCAHVRKRPAEPRCMTRCNAIPTPARPHRVTYPGRSARMRICTCADMHALDGTTLAILAIHPRLPGPFGTVACPAWATRVAGVGRGPFFIFYSIFNLIS